MVHLVEVFFEAASIEAVLIVIMLLLFRFCPQFFFKKLHADILETKLSTLRSDVYNDKLSIFDRLNAYKKYLMLGGNGNCKQTALDLILKNKEIWNSITAKKEIRHSREYKQAIEEIQHFLM